MLSEVEYLFTLIVIDDAAGKIDSLFAARKFGQKIDIVLQRFGIAIQLSHQHLVRRQGIGFGLVSFRQIPSAIELVRGDQGPLFHLMENILHIDKAYLLHIDIHPGP